MGELLDKQYKFYRDNKEMLIEKYAGRFVVIHDEEVVGSFESDRDAYVYCVTHFKVGTFFTQQVVAES
ncbi:MAG: hypothetical protein ABJP45_15260 [Cyclobacteriaceae bacterium]